MTDGFLLCMHDDSFSAMAQMEANKNGGLSYGLTDYKFYCFGGKPEFLYVSSGLENHATARISFLTNQWEYMPFRRDDYKSFEELPPQPAHFGEMREVASRLSEGIPFVRVDFFEAQDTYKFSEMTFHPCSGLMPFHPESADTKIGKLLNIRESN